MKKIIKKMDEMEMNISLKAIKGAWVYINLFLVIWIIYDYIQKKPLGLEFFLFITQFLVCVVIQSILTWKLGKDEK
jgi:hypothetical protein